MELGEHEIVFKPKTSIKAQALAYFITETTGHREVSSVDESNVSKTSTKVTQENQLNLFSEGSSCMEGAGAELILTSPIGEEVTYKLRLNFTTSNNESEYEVLIAKLQLPIKMRYEHNHGFIDSMVLTNQTNGLYEIHGKNIAQYLEKVKAIKK